jgi:hypothetical protein
MSALGLVIGLTLQYLLGMYTDLFVAFPEGAQGDAAWHFAETQIPLILHIILGLFLFTGAVALCVRAYRYGDKEWRIVSIVGLLAILAAVASGSEFVDSQNDAFSYSMAVAFLVAVAAYTWPFFSAAWLPSRDRNPVQVS